MVTLTHIPIANFQLYLYRNQLKLTMRKLFTLKSLSLLAVAFLFSTAAIAQNKPQASPADSTSGTVAGSMIKITYHSPGIKGRTIGKEIAPYGKIWRTGANEATTFSTSKDIKIGGKTLHAGNYTMYTLPNETQWKIIINSQTGQWGIKDDGSTTDDPAKDVLTVTVKPMKSQKNNERFKIEVTKTGFVLLWGNIAVPVMVKK